MRVSCSLPLLALLGILSSGQAQQGTRVAPSGALPTPLFRRDDVARQLQLSRDQLNRLDGLTNQLEQRFGPELGRLGGLNEQQRSAGMRDLSRRFTSEWMQSASSLLSPQQRERLQQLELQRQGLDAFDLPEIGRRLNLTDTQRARLREAQQRLSRQFSNLEDGSRLTPEERQKLLQTYQRSAQEFLGQILTPEQHQTWGGMIGTPFSAPLGFPFYGPGAGVGVGQAQQPQRGKQGQGQQVGMAQNQPGGMGAASPDQGPAGSPDRVGPKITSRPMRSDPFREPLFRLDHVVRGLELSREQFDRLTTLTAQLQTRYRSELDRLALLSEEERAVRARQLLRDYQEEWLKGAVGILSPRQLELYRQLAAPGEVP